MNSIIMCRYGEIILKGLNRPRFESALVKNIRRALDGLGAVEISRAQAITYIEPLEGEEQTNAIIDRLKCVFGIVSVTVAHKCEKNLDAVKEEILKSFSDEISNAKTFKVNAKRADKKFPFKSPEICEEIGGFILDNFPNIKVDVNNPELTVTVEIRDTHAFVHTGKIKCLGGMPVGTNGKAALLLSGGIDSPVAAWTMAKRGLRLDAIHFASPPYTSPRAELKVRTLLKKVAAYSGAINLAIVPFTEIQDEIGKNCPEDYFTLIMRRMMMRISEKLARNSGSLALITGESLGQVASQTLPALVTTDSVTNMPVLRPLIGMDKEEIIKISRDIDAFETSILPYEDCCTVFTPKHPKTRPTLSACEEAEKNLAVDELIEKAVNGTEFSVIE